METKITWIKENRDSAWILTLIPASFFIWILPRLSLKQSVSCWLLVSGALVAILLYSRRIPKAGTGKTGVMVAIFSETEEINERIKADLLSDLQRKMDETIARGKLIQLLTLSNGQAKRLIALDQKRLIRVLERSRADLFLSGTAKQRRLGGVDKLVLEFSVLVRHCPISESKSKAYSLEIGKLIPKWLLVSAEEQFIVLEVTAYWMEVLVRYILSFALIFEQDIRGAIKELEIIYYTLHQNRGVPQGEYFYNRVKSVLDDLYAYLCSECYAEYIDNPSADKLDSLDLCLTKAEGFNPDNYGVLLVRAAWVFLKHRDVPLAKKLIEECEQKSSSNDSWRYSDAFLTAYEGKLLTAIRKYKQAFATDCSPYTPLFVEQFIQVILDEEPHSYHLYFCLGLINFYDKQDIEAAKNDFRIFLEWREPARHSDVVQVITQLVDLEPMDLCSSDETAVSDTRRDGNTSP